MTRRQGHRVLVLGIATLSLLISTSLDARKPRRHKRPAAKTAPANFDTRLPVLGTRLAEFPAGPAKATADQACLSCHSADMVWQQRLNEKQWTASVAKMVNWGAPVPEAKRAELVEYLVKNFGPDNDRFQPVVTRPVGR
jgi:hypothetical protein